MKTYPISIIIPVYKNYEMFFKFLEINKKYFSGCEVIVMNDYPGENITKKTKKIYPNIEDTLWAHDFVVNTIIYWQTLGLKPSVPDKFKKKMQIIINEFGDNLDK